MLCGGQLWYISQAGLAGPTVPPGRKVDLHTVGPQPTKAGHPGIGPTQNSTIKTVPKLMEQNSKHPMETDMDGYFQLSQMFDEHHPLA